MVVPKTGAGSDFNEREILYKVLFDMKNDISDLKKLVLSIMQDGSAQPDKEDMALIKKLYQSEDGWKSLESNTEKNHPPAEPFERYEEPIEIEESLSLEATERELIRKALKKHNNKRKHAAQELGISERTLYRKIKEYNI